MRLTKINEIIQKNKDSIKINGRYDANSGYYTINDTKALVSGCRNLSSISFFYVSTKEILELIPTQNDDDSFRMLKANYEALSTRVHHLSYSLQMASNFLSQATRKPDEGTVYLKLPEMSNISDLKKNIETIDRSFSQLFSGYSNAPNIKFSGVDTGSEWLVLLIGGTQGLKIFLEFIKGLIDATEKLQNMKKAAAETRLLNAKAELLEMEANLLKEKRSLLIENIAKTLLKAYDKNPDIPEATEEIGKYSKALEGLISLFEQGSEIELPQITYDYEKELGEAIEKSSNQLQFTQKEVTKLLEQSSNIQN